MVSEEIRVQPNVVMETGIDVTCKLVACWLPFCKYGFQLELGPLKSCYFSIRKPTFQLFTSQHTCHNFSFYTVSEKITKDTKTF